MQCIIVTQADEAVITDLTIRPTTSDVLYVNNVAYHIDKIINENGNRLWLFGWPVEGFPFNPEAMYDHITQKESSEDDPR